MLYNLLFMFYVSQISEFSLKTKYMSMDETANSCHNSPRMIYLDQNYITTYVSLHNVQDPGVQLPRTPTHQSAQPAPTWPKPNGQTLAIYIVHQSTRSEPLSDLWLSAAADSFAFALRYHPLPALHRQAANPRTPYSDRQKVQRLATPAISHSHPPSCTAARLAPPPPGSRSRPSCIAVRRLATPAVVCASDRATSN